MLGGWEWLILLAVVLLLFGAKRLPEMARSVGQSARVFKGEMKGMKADDDARAQAEVQKPEPPKPAALPPSENGTSTRPATGSTEQPGSQSNGTR
jgi:sec-independent protein translocase protein TatA